MFCMECGAKLPDNAKFCMNCGTKVGEAGGAAASAAPAAARGCTPGKKYNVGFLHSLSFIEEDEKNFGGFEGTALEKNRMEYFTRLDDGTAVGWVCGHVGKYDRPENYDGYYYYLYRLDNDGTASYLGGGCDHGAASLYIMDGYAYWKEHLQGVSGDIYISKKTSIYDESAAKELENAPD